MCVVGIRSCIPDCVLQWACEENVRRIGSKNLRRVWHGYLRCIWEVFDLIEEYLLDSTSWEFGRVFELVFDAMYLRCIWEVFEEYFETYWRSIERDIWDVLELRIWDVFEWYLKQGYERALELHVDRGVGGNTRRRHFEQVFEKYLDEYWDCNSWIYLRCHLRTICQVFAASYDAGNALEPSTLLAEEYVKKAFEVDNLRCIWKVNAEVFARVFEEVFETNSSWIQWDNCQCLHWGTIWPHHLIMELTGVLQNGGYRYLDYLNQ